MKIKQLIEKLGELNPELEVILASDEEGNSFSFLTGFGYGTFEKDGYEIEFHSWVRDEDGEEIYPEVEVTADDATAICFWP